MKLGAIAPAMTRPPSSWRKGVAAAAIVLLIALWALAIASLSQFIGQWPILVQAPFYLFVGIAWVIPLKPLLRWSETGQSSRRRAGDD
jgi:hypothetical protein